MCLLSCVCCRVGISGICLCGLLFGELCVCVVVVWICVFCVGVVWFVSGYCDVVLCEWCVRRDVL